MHLKEGRSKLYSNFKRLHAILRKNSAGKFALICHRAADPDSFLSCYSMSQLLKNAYNCKTEIGFPDNPNETVKKLMERYRGKVASLDREYVLYFVLDCGDINLLGEWGSRLNKTNSILIDHHLHHDLERYMLALIDESSVSTAEVVLDYYNFLGYAPSKKTAQAILDAILFDSQNLLIAKDKTIINVASLCHYKASLENAREELKTEKSYDESIAKLKAASRMKIYKLNGWIVVLTRVNSYQASVARSLLRLGADVSFVAGVSNGDTRLSMRSTQEFYAKTKIHLGEDIAHKVASSISGTGGGHSTAASISSTEVPDKLLELCLLNLSKLSGLKIKELKS